MHRLTFILAVVLSLATLTWAADPAHPPGGASAASQADTSPHPRLSENPEWASGMVTFIAILFAAAFVIGPIAWKFRPVEPVVADHDHHSHSHEAHEHDRVGLDKHGAADPHAGHGGPSPSH